MKRLILAALVVSTSSLIFATEAAHAQQQPSSQAAEAAFAEVDPRSVSRGKPGRIYWNINDIQTMGSLLRQGGQICEGTKMQGTCITFSRMLGEMTITNVGRQIAGLGANFHSFRVIRATSNGEAIFDEKGNYITLVADVAKAENAAARWTTGLAAVPAAFANGGLSSLVCVTFGSCGSNGGGGSVSYAISGSEANSFLQAALGGAGGTCGSGTCPPTAPPTHSQNGPGK